MGCLHKTHEDAVLFPKESQWGQWVSSEGFALHHPPTQNRSANNWSVFQHNLLPPLPAADASSPPPPHPPQPHHIDQTQPAQAFPGRGVKEQMNLPKARSNSQSVPEALHVTPARDPVGWERPTRAQIPPNCIPTCGLAHSVSPPRSHRCSWHEAHCLFSAKSWQFGGFR